MKIALCGRFHSKRRYQGGSAEVFLALAKELSKEHDITLFGRGEPTEDIKKMCSKLKVKYYWIPADSIIEMLISPVTSFILLFKKLTDEEIINTHTGCFAISSLFFRNKRKIITNIHEVLAVKNRPLLEIINGYFENFMLFIGAKYSNLTIVNTNYTKKLIAQKGISNIVVIPNWVDSQLFKYKKNKEVDKIYKKNKLKLLFVGRLSKGKGILELIEALNYIEDIEPQLLVIGVGELSFEIKEIERKNEKVKLIGFVKHEELPKYYSAANLTILPSYSESFGLVPLESLSCGTPVLVANNSGLKEIINPKIGFFISKIEPKVIADSIRKVLDKRKHLKTQYRKYVVDNYDLANIIKKYEIEYKN